MPRLHEHHHHQWHDPTWKEWIAIVAIFLIAVVLAVKAWALIDRYSTPIYEPPASPFRQEQVGGPHESH